MRPTLRTVMVFVAGFPVSLGAVLLSTQLWSIWAAYLGVSVLVFAGDALLALPKKRITMEVDAPDTLYVGSEDPLTLRFRAPAVRGSVEVEVLCDVDNRLEPQPMQTAVLRRDDETHIELVLRPRMRGTATVKTVWLRWTGPLGLAEKRRVIELERTIKVVPNIRAVRAAAIKFFSRDAMHGIRVAPQFGGGSEYEALREYVLGMDHRAIDWKHSARHNKLVCKEFRAERNQQIIVAMDTGQLMSEPLDGITKLDHAINAGLLLAYISLRVGDRVGLFGFDAKVRGYAHPAGGVQAFGRLQQFSADLSYQHEETNFTVALAELSARLSRRSLVILLTDFVDTITAELMIENMSRLARKHLVVFVTLRDPSLAELIHATPNTLADLHRSVVSEEFTREREVVLERLHRLGVHTIDAVPSQVTTQLINRYLDIKRRELL